MYLSILFRHFHYILFSLSFLFISAMLPCCCITIAHDWLSLQHYPQLLPQAPGVPMVTLGA